MDRLPRACACCGKVMAARLVDVVIIALIFICSAQAVMKVNLAQLLAHSRQIPQHHKRGGPDQRLRPDDDNSENTGVGNPCQDYPDHPFPCKATRQCLPFRYVCDKNFDCYDESDENPEMCTASKRPPIDEIKKFLEKEKDWLMPTIFHGKGVEDVAQALAVSPTIYDFQDYLEMDDDELEYFTTFLQAVKENREQNLQSLGMPAADWPEVNYIFKNLMENGFTLY